MAFEAKYRLTLASPKVIRKGHLETVSFIIPRRYKKAAEEGRSVRRSILLIATTDCAYRDGEKIWKSVGLVKFSTFLAECGSIAVSAQAFEFR